MAFEADKVVVEVIAKLDQFDQPVKQSATSFDQNMGKVEASAGRAEKSLEKTTISAKDFAKQLAAAGNDLSKVGVGADRASTSLARYGESARSAAQRSRNLGFQIGDIGTQLAAGASPFIVLAQQGPQVANALDGASGAVGKFASFLSGPWGAAALAATTIIGGLLLKTREHKDTVEDLVEKLKDHARQTALSEEADRIWTNTLDGVIDRQHRLNEELGKRLKIQSEVDKADLAAALKDLPNLQKRLADEQARNADLKAQLARVQTPVGAAELGRFAEVRRQQLKQQVQQSNELIKSLERGITDAQGRITKGQIIVGETTGKALADLGAKADLFGEKYLGVLRGIEQGNPKLAAMSAGLAAAREELVKAAHDAASAGVDFSKLTDGRVQSLNDQLRAGKISVATYATEIRKLTTALEAQAKAAKDAAKGTGEFGKQVGFAEARKIAEAAGLAVTSGYRSTAKQAALYNDPSVNRPGNPVAKPGTSAHEGIRGRWALDIAFAPGLTPAKIKKIYGDQGVALSTILKESGHFHIEGSTSKADTAAREAQRQAEEAARNEQAFQNEKASLEGQVVDARQALLTSAEEIAALEATAVKIAHDKYADQVEFQRSIGRLQDDEAKELLKINDEREKLRLELVARRLREAQFRQQEQNFQRGRDFQAASYEAEADLLESQQGLAKTARQRHDIEQRLIDLQFAEEKLKNQYIIDWAERVKANNDATKQEKADAALAEEIAKMRAGTLDQRHANANYGNDQSNAGPLGDFFNSIPQTADQINEALENVAAHGLQTFTDSLTNAIVHFTSLGDVGRAVLQGLTADLVKLAIQQILLHTIGKALGLTAIATTTAAAAAAGAAWAGPAALASLATLGANAGPAAAALASTTALATLIGAPKAAGGRIFGPGSDTSDNILTPTSPGEFVFKAQAARSIGYDALSYMNEHGRLPSISPSNVPVANGTSRGGFSQDDIRQLRGIVGDAIAAQPDIALYPTIDPVSVVSRAFGSKAGRRAVFDFMGANAGAIKAQLR